MLKLKLTELLESLTPAEMKRFSDFVRSPFYNKNKNLTSLYDFFAKELTKKDQSNITKENIWSYLSPGKKYNDSNLRSLFSDFKKLCEEFLIVTMQEKKPSAKKNLLLEALSERELGKNFDIVSKEQSNILSNEFHKDQNYYKTRIDYERTLIERKGKNIEKNIDENYFRVSDTIDHLFLASKLDIINSLLSRKYHVLGKVNPNVKFTNEVIESIERDIRTIKKDHPVIYTEYLIIKMMTDSGSDKYFNELHSFVIENIYRMNQEMLEQVYFPLINYGFNKVAMGENKFLGKIFEIYETFEKKNFYAEMKAIQDIDLISIVIAGLRLEKITYAENFVKKYGSKLFPEVKDDCLNLVNALISQKKKEYDRAIGALVNVNYQNSYYYLKSKETLMQIYYEQNEFESLESLLDSTRHYLKRRKDLLSIHYDRYMKFLKYLGILLKSGPEQNINKGMIRKDLKKDINVIGREWLLSVVNAK